MLEALMAGVLRAAGFLFLAGIAFLAHDMSKEASAKGLSTWNLFQIFGSVLALALFMASTVGEPKCVDYEADPLGGQCLEYERGYEASRAEQAERFALIAVFLCTPIAMGLSRGKQPLENTSWRTTS